MSELGRPLLDQAADSLGGGFEAEDVYRQERQWIEALRNVRHKDGKSVIPGLFEREDESAKFALAFSGGGIRAAAFQCGVLWRLAEQNLLKDVTYLTATSGGGYITMAYASHLLDEFENNPPAEGEVKDWYRRVVAKTIVRMQDNAGDFVRDCFRQPRCIPPSWSGSCPGMPRFFDCPILIVTLVVTMMVHPIYFFLCFMFPITAMTEHFFGEEMRRAFCDPSPDDGAAAKFQRQMGHLTSSAGFSVLVYSLLLTVGLSLLTKVIVGLLDPVKSGKKLDRVSYTLKFKVMYGANAMFVRLSLLLMATAVLLVLTLGAQIVGFKPTNLQDFCTTKPHLGCLDTGDGVCVPHMVAHIELILGSVFGVTVLLMPYVGSGLVVSIACLVLPILVMLIQVRFTQFRVFGPYTGQDFLKRVPFDQEVWDVWETRLFAITLVLLCFYPEIRAILHNYYLRCLKGRFFARGADVEFSRLLRCPYCPFVVLTVTSSDYKPPIVGDDDVISELSVSPLHTGSDETFYVPTPSDRTIGKTSALSAAGCIDAVALTLSQLLTMRFLLEALNLSWGDYILFNPTQSMKKSAESKREFFQALKNGGWKAYQEKCGEFDARQGDKWYDLQGEFDRRIYHRLLPDGLLLTSFGVMFSGLKHGDSSLVLAGTCMFLALFCGSFFGNLWLTRRLQLSPFLRQLQQATAFCHRDNRPPPMLYCTDGGCRDCTTLLQMVRRREKKILMVLAASDPDDDLGVLKVAIEDAHKLDLASFYNPEDPRCDVFSVFRNFQQDRSVKHVHLGICYPKRGDDAEPEFGHLVIVKNRLPEGYECQEVQPHITENEVAPAQEEFVERGMGDVVAQPFDRERWARAGPSKDANGNPVFFTSDLGPCCCCDCCHLNGMNCGSKFPNGGFTGFLYLTPMWANSLARLSYDVSAEAVEKIKRPDLRRDWEKIVKPGKMTDARQQRQKEKRAIDQANQATQEPSPLLDEEKPGCSTM